MSKRMMVTLDEDAAKLLPVQAARVGKAHRPGRYLSELIRAAEASQGDLARIEKADLAALRQLAHDLVLEVRALREQMPTAK